MTDNMLLISNIIGKTSTAISKNLLWTVRVLTNTEELPTKYTISEILIETAFFLYKFPHLFQFNVSPCNFNSNILNKPNYLQHLPFYKRNEQIFVITQGPSGKPQATFGLKDNLKAI